MNEIECETCIKRKTKYCPNSSECYETKEKPYYQNRIMLLEENQQLKKQLGEYKHHLKNSKEMLDLQGRDGNYNYDNYMLGLYNGMEYIISLFENRSPIYKNSKDIDFLEDKNKAQQKEFIKYLTSTIEELESDDFSDERIIITKHNYI